MHAIYTDESRGIPPLEPEDVKKMMGVKNILCGQLVEFIGNLYSKKDISHLPFYDQDGTNLSDGKGCLSFPTRDIMMDTSFLHMIWKFDEQVLCKYGNCYFGVLENLRTNSVEFIFFWKWNEEMNTSYEEAMVEISGYVDRMKQMKLIDFEFAVEGNSSF